MTDQATPVMTDDEFTVLSQALGEQRELRRAQLAELERDLEISAQDDSEYNRLQNLIAETQSVLESIDAAFVRIDQKTYGACENCGSSIPVARLEVLPFARYCVRCQEKKSSR